MNEAHYFLGFYAAKANRYGESVAQLLQVKHLEKEQGSSFYRALAYGYYRLGNRGEAKINAERAVKSAIDPRDAESAKELLTYVTREPSKAAPLESRTAPAEFSKTAEAPTSDGRRRLIRRAELPASEPTYPVEGLLQQVDCMDAVARLTVNVGGSPKAFLIQDPNQVVIKNASAEGGHAFTCGPQKSVKVALEYVLKADPKYGTEGLVRSIEFR